MSGFASGSITDRFNWPRIFLDDTQYADAKTLQNPSVLKTGNVGFFLLCGQSNIENTLAEMYTTQNTAKVHDFSIWDGGLYNGQAPISGTGRAFGGGCWMTMFADKLIAAGTFDHVVLAGAAIGGTVISQWAPGGDCHQKMIAAIARCLSFRVPLTAALWQQGENDTRAGTTQAEYAASLSAMLAATRDAGLACPWLLGKSTVYGGPQDDGIRAAIDGAVNGVDVFAGADTDTLTGSTYRQPGGVHFTLAGGDAEADLWVSAYGAI